MAAGADTYYYYYYYYSSCQASWLAFSKKTFFLSFLCVPFSCALVKWY